jgi:hypothetical protein
MSVRIYNDITISKTKNKYGSFTLESTIFNFCLLLFWLDCKDKLFPANKDLIDLTMDFVLLNIMDFFTTFSKKLSLKVSNFWRHHYKPTIFKSVQHLLKKNFSRI